MCTISTLCRCYFVKIQFTHLCPANGFTYAPWIVSFIPCIKIKHFSTIWQKKSILFFLARFSVSWQLTRFCSQQIETCVKSSAHSLSRGRKISTRHWRQSRKKTPKKPWSPTHNTSIDDANIKLHWICVGWNCYVESTPWMHIKNKMVEKECSYMLWKVRQFYFALDWSETARRPALHDNSQAYCVCLPVGST